MLYTVSGLIEPTSAQLDSLKEPSSRSIHPELRQNSAHVAIMPSSTYQSRPATAPVSHPNVGKLFCCFFNLRVSSELCSDHVSGLSMGTENCSTSARGSSGKNGNSFWPVTGGGELKDGFRSGRSNPARVKSVQLIVSRLPTFRAF